MSTLDSVQVRHYMTTSIISFSPDMEVMSAVHSLVKNRIASAPVVDDSGALIGMLSERDCLSIAFIASSDSCIAGPVSQFMSNKVVSVTPDTSITHLCTMFTNASHRRYPVVENGKLVGIVSRRDALRAISDVCSGREPGSDAA
jgi:CBS domain-containing protein